MSLQSDCAVSVRGRVIGAVSVIAVAAGICGIPGCTGRGLEHAPSLHSVDSSVTLSRIEAAIPPGTSVEAAEEILEQDGWHCEDFTDEADETFLLCVYSWQQDLFVSFSTRVMVRHADGVVQDVDVDTFGTGP